MRNTKCTNYSNLDLFSVDLSHLQQASTFEPTGFMAHLPTELSWTISIVVWPISASVTSWVEKNPESSGEGPLTCQHMLLFMCAKKNKNPMTPMSDYTGGSDPCGRAGSSGTRAAVRNRQRGRLRCSILRTSAASGVRCSHLRRLS